MNGRLTAWAGQYDRQTLKPASARAFELVSLVSRESVEVVRYLMRIDHPGPEVIRAVKGAAEWLERSTVRGLRIERVPAETVRFPYHTSTYDLRAVEDPAAPPLWARFYEIATNRPFMANRDSRPVYSLADVDRERRTGYSWYGYYATKLLEKEYPAWRKRWVTDPR